MFERSKNKTTETSYQAENHQKPSEANSPSHPKEKQAVIGSSIVIVGTITGEEHLKIKGRVEGTITLEDQQVSVCRSGRVYADISAKDVQIEGEVSGDITGNEKVVIKQTGNVQGNIIAPRVILEDGAMFKGSIDMTPEKNTLTKTPLPKKIPLGQADSQVSSPANNQVLSKKESKEGHQNHNLNG